MTKKRSHKLRNGVLGLGGLAAAAYFLFPQCDGGLGFVGEGADWAREQVGLERPDAAPPRIDAAGEAARCQLRLDRNGLELEGEPVDLEDAIATCREAGAADLIVTGDARYGEFEDLNAALEAADVAVYIR